MRNFTLYGVLAHLFLALFVVIPASAQGESATDLYGTYEFTATLNITDAGQEYKDLFSDKCEVIIESHSVYDFSISGIGGSTAGKQSANLSTKVANTIDVVRPNGANSYLWGNPVIFGGANGESPYGGNAFELHYSVDADTKTITIPNFTAITVDDTWTNSTVLAYFTNCKLTLKEAEVLEVSDMSGEYTYTGTIGNAKSSVPVDFTMKLTASDDTHKLYEAAFKLGDYLPFTLNATFNGDEMTIPFDSIFLKEDKTLALANGYEPSILKGSLIFKKLTETTMRLSNYLTISAFNSESETWALEQYTTYGVVAQPTADADFTGTYHVKAATVTLLYDDDPYTVDYPAEFDFVIEKNASNGKFYVQKFLHGNVYNATQGKKPCTVKGNVLTIPVGDDVYESNVYRADDYSVMIYDVLYGPEGDAEKSITLTLNEDGTYTMTDFFIARKTYNSSESATPHVYYGDLTVEAVKEVDFAGTYKVTDKMFVNLLADGEEVDYDFPNEFEFVIEKNASNGAYYVRQFLNGDIYISTKGKFKCTANGNVLQIPVGKSVRIGKFWSDNDGQVSKYTVLCGNESGEDGFIELTVNDDGSYSLSNFYIFQMTRTYAEDWKSFTDSEVTLVGKYVEYKEPDFVGTYKVTGKKFVNLLADGEEVDYDFPNEFEFVIEKNASNGAYYVRQFLNGDIYISTQGKFKCTANGNVLQIPVGKSVRIGKFWSDNEGQVSKYTVLCGDESGEDGVIKLTVNEDGSYTLSDFYIFQMTRTYADDWKSFTDSEATLVGKYVKGDVVAVEDVKNAAAFKAYAADGAICIVGEAVPVQVFNASGVCVFSGVASKVAGLSKGLYIVKSGNATVKVML